MTSLEESIKSILSNYAGITFDVHEAADGVIEVKIEAEKTVPGGVASGNFKYCIGSE